MSDTDHGYWEQIRQWDEEYYLHITASHHEFEHIPVERAEASYFYLADGRRILDFASQTICVNVGHRHPKVVSAIKDALDRYTYITWGFATDLRARVAKLFMEDILGEEGWAGRLRITSSGSEAMETAISIAKLHAGKANVVSIQYAFHGSTAVASGGATWIHSYQGTLASDSHSGFRQVPGYPLAGHYMAPAPFCQRCPVAHTYPACKTALPDGQLPCVHAAERMIRTLGPETVAAFVVEPILWAAGIVPPPEYLPQIRELTQRLGILMILDEVVTGFGRTGTWFYYQHHPGVFPDILVMGKGLASGAVPCGGVIVSKEVDEIFQEHRWWTGGTMTSHPITAAAILGNLEAIIEENLLAQATATGSYLGEGLQRVAERHPIVAHVTGLGLAWAIELAEPTTGEPLVPEDRDTIWSGDLSQHPNRVVHRHCLEQGLLVGGYSPNVVQITPPLVVTEQECDTALAIIDDALSKMELAWT